ncbi:glycosyltransferase [Pseudomonas sp. GM21]|uniref:glycosyltransferase n=1 Tax=Pseudomonas sp. GM21 TaxID=1144325 RepID=UPI0002723B75|nr:glycosyltransferase [Pseudomonas sp. GM21]EJM23601.1 glycosyltransferase [Pseudomonas sp. GM21]
MKIAIILPSLSRSATVTVALSIAGGLIAVGHEVDVFYFDHIVEQPVPVGCGVQRINFFQKIDFMMYDVVHSHNLRPDLYVAINRSHIRGICVSTIHNFVREELKNYHGGLVSIVFTKIWRFAWQRMDCLVCLTKDAVGYYQKLLPASYIYYVYNGVSISDASDITVDSTVVNAVVSLKKSGFFVLGTYCNQTKQKGIEQIVHLVHSSQDVAAIIIGEGPFKPSLVSLAKELGVEDRCLFFPFLPYAYIYNKYFDAYIIPSRTEGFGIALVEASLCDVNIMCSDISAFREMFDESEVSFFRLDDMKGMLEIVGEIKAGLDKRDFARRKSQRMYSVESMVDGYLKCYDNALARLMA